MIVYDTKNNKIVNANVLNLNSEDIVMVKFTKDISVDDTLKLTDSIKVVINNKVIVVPNYAEFNILKVDPIVPQESLKLDESAEHKKEEKKDD